MRYFLLVMLASAALYAVVRVGASSPEFVLVDAGDSTGSITSPDFSFWFLTSVAGLTIVSLCRFVAFGIPSMIGTWYEGHSVRGLLLHVTGQKSSRGSLAGPIHRQLACRGVTRGSKGSAGNKEGRPFRTAAPLLVCKFV